MVNGYHSMNRRKFLCLAAGVIGGVVSSSGCSNESESPWTPDARAEVIRKRRIYVTSAFWEDSSIDAAKKYQDRYDAVCIPGISCTKDGTLVRGSMIEDAEFVGKPKLYIIQNHPEAQTWDVGVAAAFMDLGDEQLRDQLAPFKEGIVLDLESLTEEMNESYHEFVQKVRNAYDAPLIVSLHAKIRHGEQVYGLGKEMDYEAICNIADAVNYMTLDEWPGNPEVPIADLDCFRSTLDTLFEQEGVDCNKLIASIATYIKVSYLKEDGSFDTEREPEQAPAKGMLSKLKNLEIENKEEGQFVANYKKDANHNEERVKGWMMTKDAFRARMDVLREYGINKVFFWYGGEFLATTPTLRRIVYRSQ